VKKSVRGMASPSGFSWQLPKHRSAGLPVATKQRATPLTKAPYSWTEGYKPVTPSRQTETLDPQIPAAFTTFG
jgi:hypothetical protein